MLDIAAGNGGGTGFKGVAPNADLCFAQVYVSETKKRRYVDGTSVFNAISYALTQLGTTSPTVVSVSLGTNDGPHDNGTYGMSAWNGLIDALFDTTTARALVWSAGNQGLTDAHLTGMIKKNDPAIFDIRLPRGESFGSEFKIWLDKPAATNLTIEGMLADYKDAPGGYNPSFSTSPVKDEANNPCVTFGPATKYGTGTDLHFIQAVLLPGPLRTTPPGDKERFEVWRFRLSTDSTKKIPFHAWLDHDARDQARFVTNKNSANAEVDPNCSLSAAAAGLTNATIVGAITPGGYQPGKPIFGPGQGGSISFSSYGPTRGGLQRPDVSAPGDAIRGARSKGDPIGSKSGYGPVDTIAMTGTSMAAPHVAGIVALYLEKLKSGGEAPPTSNTVRLKLRSVARPSTAGGTAKWDNQRGCGCVDAKLLLK